MSSQHHRHARAQLDQLIRDGYHLLFCSTAATRRMYTRILISVRQRSTLLRPIGDQQLLRQAVQAIAALARYHSRFVAPPETWAGGEGNVYQLIHALAEHLLGHYPVPRCLATVWLAGAGERVARAREWFIAHARGLRFRQVPALPIPLTRKMERLLLQSPHHLDIHAAIRRAELLGLGATPELVEAVLATRLGRELEHGEFWRGVMQWFIVHWDELEVGEVAAIIDLIDALRFVPTRYVTAQGELHEPPPEPGFCLDGRTPATLRRLIAQRRYEVLLQGSGYMEWQASGLAAMLFAEAPRPGAPGGDPDAAGDGDGRIEWQFVELLDSKQLRIEGSAMHHCVGIYAWRCRGGGTSIWSLRRREPGGRLARRYTIEVDLARRRIVQIRGHCNVGPRAHALRIIGRWAAVAGLALAC